jgi:hypothetical protein
MGNSGSMAGYRWGIARKQALINREVAAQIQMSVNNWPGIRRRVSIYRQQPEFDHHFPDLP